LRMGKELRAIDALLSGLVDYAGLFPPASEGMRTAAENYAAYREGADSAALGRFIVPSARLGELEEQARGLLPRDTDSDPWRLSVLAGGNVQSASEETLRFNERHSSGSAEGHAVIDVVELKAMESADIERQRAALSPIFTTYFEIPTGPHVASLVETLAEFGGRAKIRTGGVTPETFPTSRDVVDFMLACHRYSVPFKATAGLHHPVRGHYRLTYDRDSAKGLMFGFLNVFMAAALIHLDQNADLARGVLEETDAGAFVLTDEAMVWRGRTIDADQIVTMRSKFAISFGSCSFREPIDELAVLDGAQAAHHS
jgi:hypothetical protein